MYRKAIVTFLDILGFAGLVKSGTAADVKKRLETVSRFAAPPVADPVFSPISIAFSDSIVRVRFLDGENEQCPLGIPFSELLDIAHIQTELVSHDVILRGAVSYGEIYAEGNVIFGPALVRAYELETKMALYPRVVVDPDLLNATKVDRSLGAEHHSTEDDRKYLRSLLSRGENGLWFVDYLRVAALALDDAGLEPEFLSRHKILITSRYANQSARVAALEKLLWLAVYHNRRMATLGPRWFSEHGVDKKKFVITTKEIPALARMPKRGRSLL